jgi:hypothetical protein
MTEEELKTHRFEQWLTTGAAVIAVLSTIIGGTVVIESRYAKAQEVKAQLNEFYEKQIKLRILEIDLKPNPTPSDKALREYLVQELNKN